MIQINDAKSQKTLHEIVEITELYETTCGIEATRVETLSLSKENKKRVGAFYNNEESSDELDGLKVEIKTISSNISNSNKNNRRRSSRA